MLNFSKLSALSVLGSVLFSTTCVLAMEPEDMSFAAKQALVRGLGKPGSRPGVTGQNPASAQPQPASDSIDRPVGKLPTAMLEALAKKEISAPVTQIVVALVPEGVAMKKGTPPPPPPPGAMGKKVPVTQPVALPQAAVNAPATPRKQGVQGQTDVVNELQQAVSNPNLRPIKRTPEKVTEQPKETTSPFGERAHFRKTVAAPLNPAVLGKNFAEQARNEAAANPTPFGQRLRSASTRQVQQDPPKPEQGAQSPFGPRVSFRKTVTAPLNKDALQQSFATQAQAADPAPVAQAAAPRRLPATPQQVPNLPK